MAGKPHDEQPETRMIRASESRAMQRLRLEEGRLEMLARREQFFADIRRRRHEAATSLAMTREALGDAETRSEGSPWTALATGFAILAVVGVAGVVVYLMLRKKDDNSITLGAYDPRMLPPSAPTPQVFMINAGTGQAVRADGVTPTVPSQNNATTALDRIEALLQARNVRAQRVPTTAMMKTFRLPWLGDSRAQSQAIRVATSLANPYEVIVRVVAPSGALAALSFSQTELENQPIIAPGISSIPTGDVVIIPAGGLQKIRMNPRQALFGRGNMSPDQPTGAVLISVSATDDFDAY